MKIYSFYHIYADGNWIVPTKEHFLSLKRSLLIDNIEKIFIGIVGEKRQRDIVKSFLNSLEYTNIEVVCEERDGWEQETLIKLQEFCQLNKDSIVLYCHTKGASKVLYTEHASAELDHAWRREMTFHNVKKWQTAVWHIEKNNCDTVGIFSQSKNGKFIMWAGNFWWAKSEYINTLPKIDTSDQNRAEDWIGLGQGVKVFDMHEGYPSIMYFNNGLSIKHNSLVPAHI